MKNWTATLLLVLVTSPCFSQVIIPKEITIGCLNLTKVRGDVIIRSQEEYEKLYQSRSPHPDCNSSFLPAIDFTAMNLVGLDAGAGGCVEPEIKLALTKTPEGCKIEMNVKQVGICKALFQKRIWILIDKSESEKIVINKNRN